MLGYYYTTVYTVFIKINKYILKQIPINNHGKTIDQQDDGSEKQLMLRSDLDLTSFENVG